MVPADELSQMQLQAVARTESYPLATDSSAQGFSFGATAGSPQIQGPENCLLPFNAQPPWMHGFGRRQPTFGGHFSFRPSNYHQAIPRANYLRALGLPHSQQFWDRYQDQPTAFRSGSGGSNRRKHQPVELVPASEKTHTISLANTIEDGMMSPIHSIRILAPRRLPSAVRKESKIIRAIQHENTGPLFPLPF